MASIKKYNGSTFVDAAIRKYSTASEIITPPTTIYADGTNATVGLKGNMQQTGTPTSQTPIQPSECGDLETSGAKAGQYKIPISSANTTTPVYLGEVETTRKVKKYEITGLEDWTARSGTPENVFFCERQDVNYINNAAICSHYANQDSGSFADLQDKHSLVRVASSGNKSYFGIRDSSYPSTNEGVAQLRDYLQQQYANGTPVTVWYVLATATTGIVNEPLRKIGDYVDTVSGITIPTITGKDTVDVETTLKPSEVSLSYTGWHDASVKEAVRTVNIYDKYNVLDIPGLGIRYGVECELGTYSIYNNTDNTVFWGTNDWASRHVACEPHSTTTITIQGTGVSGFLMGYNDASLGEITIVRGTTVPDHYIPYIDWD